MKKFINSTPWFLVLIACLTLGLAPYNPPHFYEKILMLLHGTLSKPIDWFDFTYHLVLKNPSSEGFFFIYPLTYLKIVHLNHILKISKLTEL